MDYAYTRITRLNKLLGYEKDDNLAGFRHELNQIRSKIQEAYGESDTESDTADSFEDAETCRQLPTCRKSHFTCLKKRFYDLDSSKNYAYEPQPTKPIQFRADRYVTMLVKPITVTFQEKPRQGIKVTVNFHNFKPDDKLIGFIEFYNTKTKKNVPKEFSYEGHSKFSHKVRYRELCDQGAVSRSKTNEYIINVNLGITTVITPSEDNINEMLRNEVDNRLTSLESRWDNELKIIDEFVHNAFDVLMKFFRLSGVEEVRRKIAQRDVAAMNTYSEENRFNNKPVMGATIPHQYYGRNEDREFSLEAAENTVSREYGDQSKWDQHFQPRIVDCNFPPKPSKPVQIQQPVERLDYGRARISSSSGNSNKSPDIATLAASNTALVDDISTGMSNLLSGECSDYNKLQAMADESSEEEIVWGFHDKGSI